MKYNLNSFKYLVSEISIKHIYNIYIKKKKIKVRVTKQKMYIYILCSTH